MALVLGEIVRRHARTVPDKPAYVLRDDNRRQRFLKQRLSLVDGSQGQSSFRESISTPVWILMSATALLTKPITVSQIMAVG